MKNVFSIIAIIMLSLSVASCRKKEDVTRTFTCSCTWINLLGEHRSGNRDIEAKSRAEADNDCQTFLSNVLFATNEKCRLY